MIRVVVVSIVLAGWTASACGPKQYHTAVVANTSIAQAIFAVQDAEIAAHTAGFITADQHAVYKAQILTLLLAGDDLTLALKDWNPSLPVPANVGAAMGNVQRLLTDLQLNSPQATALLFTVQTVLSVLRGVGVLPAANDGAEAREGRIVVEVVGVSQRQRERPGGKRGGGALGGALHRFAEGAERPLEFRLQLAVGHAPILRLEVA
jgi:hypothetical protein